MPFLEKSHPRTPIQWKGWKIILKLAIIAKEGNSINIPQKGTPIKETLQPQAFYEKDVGKSTAQNK